MTRDDLRNALAHPNVAAFLRAIRLGEGTSDDAGYRRIVGEVAPEASIESFDEHPRRRIWIKRYSVFSTAAGAYQIIAKTWDALQLRYRFPDFSPECQDEAAVALIAERGALDDVLSGEIILAIHKCAAIWASLPGSVARQHVKSLNSVLAEYQSHGGSLA